MRLSERAQRGAQFVKDMETELDLAYEVIRMLLNGTDPLIISDPYKELLKLKTIREERDK